MDIIKQLHDLCIAENISISVAESCTSGLIASKITSISGSSAYFKGGIIAYQNEIKVNFLSVSQRMIDEKSEVLTEVVEQMASGGTKKNPVGTVFIAIATETKLVSSKFYFSGSRQSVVNQAADEGLRMLIEKIKKEE
jgi:nicotinamide mononucleotide (NMN) deamidase PncC